MLKLLPVFITLFLFNSTFGQTDDEILQKTITKLESLKTIEYNLISHEIVKTRGLNRIEKAYCYFDFTSKDTLIQAKYQFNSKHGEFVFNGSQFFNTIPNEEILLYEEAPSIRRVTSLVFMMNSLFTLREVLPELVVIPDVKIMRLNDSLVNNIDCYRFNIFTPKFIALDGKLRKQEEGSKPIKYILSISKRDYLPVQFGNYYLNNNGSNISTYTDLKIVTPRNQSTWNYNMRPLHFKRSTISDYVEAFRYNLKSKIGTDAIDWKLPLIKGDSIQFSNTKGKLVLLEFFFPYCGGCVAANPEINKINDQYKNDGLITYGIEFTNADSEGLINYIDKQKIEIPILYNGKDVSKKYEINSAPTFILIDKNGKIIHASSGFNKDSTPKRLIKIIEENLF